jgi:hypothetical protein
METYMKLTVPGIMITALLVASPAFAQYTNTGTTSTPGASVAKDDSWTATKKRTQKHAANHKHKKHMASYKQRHHAKAMSSKAQTTGSGSTSAPKDDTAPKSR